MYSKYISGIQLRNDPREPIVGGAPIQLFQNLTSELAVMGGGSGGLQKIAHLSIPLGLVLSAPIKYAPPYKQQHQSQDDASEIDENLFHKLYSQTTYQTKSSAKTGAKTRRRRRRN